jgi:hypothetical protein
MGGVSKMSRKIDTVTEIPVKKLLSKSRCYLRSDDIALRMRAFDFFNSLNLIMSQSVRTSEDAAELLAFVPKKSSPRVDAYLALTTLLPLIIAEGAVGVMAAMMESMESWTPAV